MHLPELILKEKEQNKKKMLFTFVSFGARIKCREFIIIIIFFLSTLGEGNGLSVDELYQTSRSMTRTVEVMIQFT